MRLGPERSQISPLGPGVGSNRGTFSFRRKPSESAHSALGFAAADSPRGHSGRRCHGNARVHAESLRHSHRERHRCAECEYSRCDRHDQGREHRPRAVGRDRRRRHLHDSQHHRRHLHVESRVAGLQGIRPDRHSDHRRRHRPHQRPPRGWCAERSRHGHHRSRPPEDGQGRRQRRPAPRGCDEPAVEPVPELSGT